jgi:hypothetical protein
MEQHIGVAMLVMQPPQTRPKNGGFSTNPLPCGNTQRLPRAFFQGAKFPTFNCIAGVGDIRAVAWGQ